MLRLIAFFGLATTLLTADEPASAVVALLEGSATVISEDGHSSPARLFDWLKDRASIETGPKARAIVVLANGARYQIGERSRGTVQGGALAGQGKIQLLGELFEMPRLAAIADPKLSARGGAVRIRGPRLRHCYPIQNASVLSSQAALYFQASADAASYRLRVEDDAGKIIYRVESAKGVTVLPAGLLKPGERYYWEVRGQLATGNAAAGDAPRCEAEFRVLPAEDEARRTAWKTAIEKSGDTDLLALFAEIDRRLGLLHEAKAGFLSILNKARNPDAIRGILSQIDALMEAEN